MPGRVIPAQHYLDPKTGRTFSVFSSWMPEGCVLVTKGYTIGWPDGTEGCGRKPFATEEEAEAYLKKVPKGFTGMHSLGN